MWYSEIVKEIRMKKIIKKIFLGLDYNNGKCYDVNEKIIRRGRR